MDQPASKTRPLPVALGVLGVVAVLLVVPVGLSVATARGGDPAKFLQEGGWGMWALLALTAFGGLATVGIAIWQTLRPCAWAGVLSVFPLLLGLTAAGFEWLAWRRVLAALGASANPTIGVRILAVADAEILALSVLAGVAVSSLLSAASVVSGARALSRVVKGGFGLAAGLGLGAGLAGLAVALLVAGPHSRGSSLLFPTVAVLAVVVATVLAGVAVADKSAEPEAKALALGDLLHAAVYGAAGVLVAATVVRGMGQRFALQVLGDPTVDPAQLGRLLFDGLDESRSALWHGLFFAPIVAAPLAAMATQSRHVGAALRQAGLGLLLPFGVGLLVVLMFVLPRSARLEALAAEKRESLPSGLTLPVVVSSAESADSADLAVGAQDVHVFGKYVAKTAELAPTRCQEIASLLPKNSRAGIAIDQAVTYEQVACIGRALGQRDVFSLGSGVGSGFLPPPWDILSKQLSSVRLEFAAGKVRSGGQHVHLRVDSWEARLGYQRRTLKGPIEVRTRALFDDLHGKELGVSADPEVSFDTITLLASQKWRLKVRVYFNTTPEAALNPPAMVGSGRLPKEVIQRIVRQNYGKFRACYEAGLAVTPKLEGVIKVAFTIDRDGTVATATDKGSDLPDRAVVDCVVKAFSGLSFPEPESGVVRVVYPIRFEPGSM